MNQEMENIDHFTVGLSFSMILIFGIISAVIFLGFGIYRRLILPVILSKYGGFKHKIIIDRLETISWIIFSAAFIYYALITNYAVTSIMIALIVLLFFDFWKNFFAGLIIKFGNKLHTGDSISVNEFSGKIQEFGYSNLSMLSVSGEEIRIPYHLINTEVKIGQKSVPKILFKTISVELDSEIEYENKKFIEKTVYNNPWIIISKAIDVEMEDRKTKISFYVLNNHFFEKARKRLIKDLAGKSTEKSYSQ